MCTYMNSHDFRLEPTDYPIPHLSQFIELQHAFHSRHSFDVFLDVRLTVTRVFLLRRRHLRKTLPVLQVLGRLQKTRKSCQLHRPDASFLKDKFSDLWNIRDDFEGDSTRGRSILKIVTSTD